jgi:hypothetical protein
VEEEKGISSAEEKRIFEVSGEGDVGDNVLGVDFKLLLTRV